VWCGYLQDTYAVPHHTHSAHFLHRVVLYSLFLMWNRYESTILGAELVKGNDLMCCKEVLSLGLANTGFYVVFQFCHYSSDYDLLTDSDTSCPLMVCNCPSHLSS